MIVALAALVIALGGTAFAASRYIITSTSQIKPSVLRELRGSAVAATVKAPKGPRAIIDRMQLQAPVATSSETRLPMSVTGATWTQEPSQANGLFGQVTVTAPSEVECRGEGAGGVATVEAKSDDGLYAEAYVPLEASGETGSYTITWYPLNARLEDSSAWLPDTGSARSHTLHFAAFDDCLNGGHFTIDSLQIDVLGFR